MFTQARITSSTQKNLKIKIKPINKPPSKNKKGYEKYGRKMLRQYFFLKNNLNISHLNVVKRHIKKDKILKILNKEDYNCCICLQIMINPIIMKCGHPYCLQCVQSLAKSNHSKNCPVCRKQNQMQSYQKNPFIEKMIHLLLHDHFKCEPKQLKMYTKRSHRLKISQWRGLRLDKKINDKIQVKINDKWQQMLISSIIKTKEATFFNVRPLCTDVVYLFPQNSLNLRQLYFMMNSPVSQLQSSPQPQQLLQFYNQNPDQDMVSHSLGNQMINLPEQPQIQFQNDQSFYLYSNVFSTPVRQMIQIDDRFQLRQNIIIQNVPRRQTQVIVIED